MTEREQLEQAIISLEAQRAILGDSVVDSAISALRKQLSELSFKSTEQNRKHVTVLFADISGFTAMSETKDAEEVSDLMIALWQQMDAVIIDHGGHIDKHIGDAVMALWGVERVREDDSERAIRAALAIQAKLISFSVGRNINLTMRIGLNTGPVLLGEVRSGEFTAIGDTVNLASRMEQTAPMGGVLISHDTFHHVRGIFDVLPQTAKYVKGKTDPVQTYVVQGSKDKAFRMETRGVDGVETRMIGRDAELLTLQNIFHDAIEDSETQLITIVGDAGVGKSRLLFEFENWLELFPDDLQYFKGRSTLEMQTIPFGLIRDMIAYHFDIRESESVVTALEKFRSGAKNVLNADQSDIAGHMIGFDFSSSTAVQKLLGSPSFGKIATAYLVNYIHAVSRMPTVILLEDVHWADDSSLDFLDHLVTAIPNARLILICLARPDLFERRPNGGGGKNAYLRLDIKALSKRASRELVGEILQRMEDVPESLKELIVKSAGGNPFYVEELIKMLIEDDVIDRQNLQWRVNLDQLADVRVPPTLTGVLQARLDSLPKGEKALLQRAAVVGRLFWDAVLADLKIDDADKLNQKDISSLLKAVLGRELIYQREQSVFRGTNEYIFKHAILRDVTYETVLLKLRPTYHAQVAQWLEASIGERSGQYLGLIANHYERAGNQDKAAEYLLRTGDELYKIGAYADAIKAFERLLALSPDNEVADKANILVKLGKANNWAGNIPLAIQRLDEVISLTSDSPSTVAAYIELGSISWEKGIHGIAQQYFAKGLTLARELNDKDAIGRALWMMSSYASMHLGDFKKAKEFAEEGLSIYRELEDLKGIANALVKLGFATLLQGEHEKSTEYLEESLDIHEEIGNRFGTGVALNGLAENARLQSKYKDAVQYNERCLAINRELNKRHEILMCLSNLGNVHSSLGNEDLAWGFLLETLRGIVEIGAIPVFMFETLASVSGLEAKAGNLIWATEILGLVLGHPELDAVTRRYAEPMLASLREKLPSDDFNDAFSRGGELNYEEVIAKILLMRNNIEDAT